MEDKDMKTKTQSMELFGGMALVLAVLVTLYIAIVVFH
jgi:hypothetical protein